MENKTPEEILDKYINEYNLTVSNLHKFKLNQKEKKMFANAMLEYAAQFKSDAGRWVKASERLPKVAGEIAWRFILGKHIYCGYKSDGFQIPFISPSIDFHLIEWLDETPSRQWTDEERLYHQMKVACKFLNWYIAPDGSKEGNEVEEALGRYDSKSEIDLIEQVYKIWHTTYFLPDTIFKSALNQNPLCKGIKQ